MVFFKCPFDKKMKKAFAESFNVPRVVSSGAAVLSLTILAVCGCQNMAVMEGEKPSDLSLSDLSLRNLIIW